MRELSEVLDLYLGDFYTCIITVKNLVSYILKTAHFTLFKLYSISKEKIGGNYEQLYANVFESLTEMENFFKSYILKV